MAQETYGAALQYVWAKRESTYGTDPTPAATDVVYVEDFEVKYVQEAIKRQGASPQGGGFKPVMGVNFFEISGKAEVDYATISSADSTDRPKCDWALYLCQGVLTSDATDKTHTYVWGTQAAQGVTLYVTDINDANDNGRRKKAIGCQASPKFMWSAGERFLIEFSGAGKGAAASSSVVANLGAAADALTYPTVSPVVAQGGVIKIVNLSDDSVYGGGSLGSPTQGLAVVSFECDLGSKVDPQRGAGAAGGIQRVRALRSEAPSMSLQVEVADLNEFNPYALKESVQPLEIQITFTSGSNSVAWGCNAVIVEVEETDGDGRKLYDLTCDLIYLEDPSDGSPAAGLSPSQAPKAGANQGLPLQPAGTLPAGICWLQFATA